MAKEAKKRKRRSSEQVREAILDYLKQENFPRTTGQIADEIGINWDSANAYLREMKKKGVLYHEKVGRQNQWCLREKWEGGFGRYKANH